MERIVRIPIAGCWIFTGALNEAGYGVVGKGGRGSGTDRAHRVTYSNFVGEITDGLFVCHHCDQPACCNPEHLFLGTNAENMADCRSKGRDSKPPRNPHVVGSVHPGAKLTEARVIEMRALREQGWTESALASRYEIHPVSVHKIVHRQRWRHVA
jgi:hypothetical protein